MVPIQKLKDQLKTRKISITINSFYRLWFRTNLAGVIVEAQIVRPQQEIDKLDPVYLHDDAIEEYVLRVLTEYIVQNLPDGY